MNIFSKKKQLDDIPLHDARPVMALGGQRVRRYFLLAAALACIVAVGSVVSIERLEVVSIERLESENSAAFVTEQFMSTLDQVLSLTTDSETAGRGYTITGLPEYIEPYMHASDGLDGQLALLRQLIPQGDQQARDIDRLAAMVRQREAQVAHVIAVRREHGFEAAKALILQGNGKRLHDRIRTLVGDMKLAKGVIRDKKLLSSSQSTRWSIASVLLGSMLVVASAAFSQWLARRDYVGSRRANATLAQANLQLDARVATRTGELSTANEQLQLAEAVFMNTQESIVITDVQCLILGANPAFTRSSEYALADLLGKHARLMKSGRHDRSFYLQMWQNITLTGSWQGEIWNRRQGGDIYLEWLGISTVHDDAGQPKYYIGVASDLSRMNRAPTALEHLAHHDALTGLPNRLLLASRLGHSIERGRRDSRLCAVLCLDLDRFKAVNDTWGHGAGDDLLRQVAQRIRRNLRDVDTLARVGGDEFVIVLEGLFLAPEAGLAADLVIDQFAKPFTLSKGTAVQVGVSVGISVFPNHGTTQAELLEQADTALYCAKQAGGNVWRLAASAQGVAEATPA